MLHLALLIALQDTVSEHRLERTLSSGWDVFVEINGVEACADGFKKSPMSGLLKETGVDVEEWLKLVKGQWAIAYDFPASLVMSAECRDAESAKKLAEALEAQGVVTIEGAVVWMATSKDLISGPVKASLADDATFKKARELTHVGKGSAFAYVSVGEIPSFVSEHLAQLRAAATSLKFEASRVSQTHALIGADEPTGVMKILLGTRNWPLALSKFPKSTAVGLHVTGLGAGALMKIAKELSPLPKAVTAILDPFIVVPGEIGGCVFQSGDGVAGAIEGDQIVLLLEALVNYAAGAGEWITKERKDGATLGELKLGAGPFGAYAIKGGRAIVGKDRAQVEEAMKAESAESEAKALLAGDTFEGLAFWYSDYAKLAAHGSELAGPEARKVFERAGRSVEWVAIHDGAIVIEARSTSGLSLLTAAALALPGRLK